MGSLAKLLLRYPWLTIVVIVLITIFFGYQLQFIQIDNQVKYFLPDSNYAKQQYLRMEELFGGEIVGVIGVSADAGGPYPDIYNPTALRLVQQLTDWAKEIEIESRQDHLIWVKTEDIDNIPKSHNRLEGFCTPQMLEVIKQHETPADLTGYSKIYICMTKEKQKLDKVLSLADTKMIYDKVLPPVEPKGEAVHELAIENIWSKPPETQVEADAIRRRVNSWDKYKNNLVSPDNRSTAIYFFIPTNANIEFVEKLQKLIDENLAALERPNDGLSFQVGGIPMITVWMGRYLLSDLRLLIPFVFLVIIGVLILSFRNLTGVLLPSLTVAIANIWTIGFVAFVGKPLSLITSALPTLMVAVGSAYTIHIIHHYFEQMRTGRPKREVIIDTIRRVGMAVVMAGLTTVGGFLSLSTSSVLPIRDFGWFAGFGTFAALFVSLVLVPPILLLKREKAKKMPSATTTTDANQDEEGRLSPLLERLGRFIVGHKRQVLAATLVLISVCAYLTSKVEVTSNLASYFHPSSPIRVSDDFLNRQFGGTNVFSLSLDGGEKDFWKDPERLRKIEGLGPLVQKKFPIVGDTLSVVDYIKKMNMALHYDDPAQYRIPDTKQAVAETLFLFAQKSDSLESAIDFNYQTIRLAFKCRDGHTHVMGQIEKFIDGWMKENFPEMLGRPAPTPSWWYLALYGIGITNPWPKVLDQKYIFSGTNYLRLVVDRLVVTGQVRSIFFSILIVFILAAIIFRSFVGGLLSVVPTIVTILCNFAIMAAFKIPLDIGTALVSNAAVGMGIDYAIHYINRYRLEKMAGEKTISAIIRTHRTTGVAILYNATAVALGFFVCMLSNFQPVKMMGLLTGITMFIASFTALTFLPVLLIILRPRFIRKVSKEDDANNGGVS